MIIVMGWLFFTLYLYVYDYEHEDDVISHQYQSSKKGAICYISIMGLGFGCVMHALGLVQDGSESATGRWQWQ